eukprot:CAMPEP_0167753846 /NCGR_PEP_ID=MMETSP0110_2-20121227/7941_1 /TAXON_ID=629695 /ORGANISM="Gymnochlora sp., Strain CCMP2014" /LENGTH=757 /DNA_ID=CAMNT_0007639659 /DNA_START=88 /DNA_END=2360 /DNA_ORIENTATION=-
MTVLDEDGTGVFSAKKLPKVVASIPDDRTRAKCLEVLSETKTEQKHIGHHELQKFFQRAKVDTHMQKRLYTVLEDDRRKMMHRLGQYDWLQISRKQKWRIQCDQKIEKIKYSGIAVKYTSYHQRRQRILIVTTKAIYFVDHRIKLKRRLLLHKISRLSCKEHSLERVIHVIAGKNLRFRESKDHPGFVETIKKCYQKVVHTRLRVETYSARSLNSGKYSNISNSENRHITKSISTDAYGSARAASYLRSCSSRGNRFCGRFVAVTLYVDEPSKDRRRSSAFQRKHRSIVTGGVYHQPVTLSPKTLAALLDQSIGKGARSSPLPIYVEVESSYLSIACLAVVGRKKMPANQIFVPKVLQKKLGIKDQKNKATVKVRLVDLEMSPVLAVYPFDDIIDRFDFRRSSTQTKNRRSSVSRGSRARSAQDAQVHMSSSHNSTNELSLEKALLPLLVNTGKSRFAYREAFLGCYRTRHWARIVHIDEIIRNAFTVMEPGFEPRGTEGAFQAEGNLTPRLSRQQPLSPRHSSPRSSLTRGYPLRIDLDSLETTSSYRLAYLTFGGKNLHIDEKKGARSLSNTSPAHSISVINSNDNAYGNRKVFSIQTHVENAEGVKNFRHKRRNEQRFSSFTAWCADACHEKGYKQTATLRRVMNIHLKYNKRILHIIEHYLGSLGPQVLSEAQWDVSSQISKLKATATEFEIPETSSLFLSWSSNKSHFPLEFYTFLSHQDAVVLCLDDGGTEKWGMRQKSMESVAIMGAKTL